MNRRTALHCGGLALAGLLSGCSIAESSGPTTITISEIEIRNRLDSEIDVSVLLLNEGEAEYWQAVTVPASPNPFATMADLPDGSGEYALYGQLPAVDRDASVQANLVEDAGDQSCITVHLEVTKGEANNDGSPSLVYGAIGECQESR